jgi:hypothetical protein
LRSLKWMSSISWETETVPALFVRVAGDCGREHGHQDDSYHLRCNCCAFRHDCVHRRAGQFARLRKGAGIEPFSSTHPTPHPLRVLRPSAWILPVKQNKNTLSIKSAGSVISWIMGP